MKLKNTIAISAVFLGLASLAGFSQKAIAQAPSVTDLVDNNRAFIKLDRANTHLGDAFSMHFIAPLLINGEYWTYYIKNVGGMGIGLAKSTDGKLFKDQGMVLRVGSTGAVDSTYASFPGVWYENGTFYLVYEAAGDGAKGFNGDIGLATSTDGINFTKQGIILWHNTSGWESTNIGTPSLYKENGIWYLHYHGYNGDTCQIGVATGTDLKNLVKSPANPIIKSIPGTAQSGTAGRRGIVKEGGRYFMVYEVSEKKISPEAPGFEGAKWSSSIASSNDLINWTAFSQNNVLPQTVLADGFGNDGPTFMKVGAENYIYYRVSGMNPVTRRALIANENYGGFDISWAMNGQNIGHTIGRPDGDGWSANMSQDAAQYLQYGPYYSGLPAGDHIATWSLMIDNNSSDDAQMMRLEVVDVDDGFNVIAQRNITRKQWKQTGRYEYFSVPFRLDAARLNHRLELRAYWYGRAFIREGRVGLS